MSESYELLSFAEVGRLLGLEERKIKQLTRDNILLGVKGPQGLSVPADMLVKGEHGWETLEHLPGTLTLLADAGYSPEEALGWLYRHDEELDQTPMAALRAGRHHRVNVIANALGF